MRSKIPFHRPSIGDEEIAEVVDTLRSGWLTTGPKTKQFEREFAEYAGVKHAVAVNSCTAALHLALEAIGVHAGDEVVIPTYTFTAVGEVIAYLGAKPVLADVRADTLNVDASTIEPLLTEHTKAIVPVHFAGQAVDMDPILELARNRGLHVLEDAAHALPATYKGRRIGSVGDITAFSFYATKTVTTGEGGMVATQDEHVAARVRQMSLHGLSGNAWGRYAAQGAWFYDVLDFGFKYNMTDLAAAIGIHQLRKAEALRLRRCEIARIYNEGLKDLGSCELPSEVEYGTHAWHLYILRIRPECLRGDRDLVIRRLTELGIGTSVHFIPLHLHSIYRKSLGHSPEDFPVATTEYERVISLPIYPAMTDEEVARVVDAVRSVLAELGG